MESSFGLQLGQIRTAEDIIARGASWYDGTGRSIGYGDISGKDCMRISRVIADGDFFIILPAVAPTDRGETADIRSILDHAAYIICRSGLYRLTTGLANGAALVKGVWFNSIVRAEAHTMLLGRASS